MVNIFQYLEKVKGKPIPLEYKILNKIPLTEEELIIDRDLDLDFEQIISLPNNLTFNGNLYVCWSDLITLPNNLTVIGYLHISETSISELPDNLYVGGNLYCRDTPLSKRLLEDYDYFKKCKNQVKGKIIC